MVAYNFIEFRNISKIFPGCMALNNVNFKIAKGEIHALVGENGAGKSTLLNILHGALKPTIGEVCIDGTNINFKSAHDAIKSGIVKVHQEVNMVLDMTVAQNLMLGSEPGNCLFVDNKKMYKDAEKLLLKVNSNINPDDKLKSLTVGQMQILQIAKAIHLNANIISFDEPTTSLSKKETDVLFKIIEEMRNRGITIIYVSHRMNEIFKISNKITVLRDGQYIDTFDTNNIDEDKLILNMVGRDVSSFAQRLKPPQFDKDENVLEVTKLAKTGVFSNINFNLKKGEILGFYGLVGSKRTDVMKAIFGAEKVTDGKIVVKGKEINNKNPEQAIINGIGLIPENRKSEGFIFDFSNSDNVALPTLKKFQKNGLQNLKKKKSNYEKYAELIGIKPSAPDFKTNNLSGGNQQKVILAKWLSTQVDIMIFDEPTKRY